MDRRIFSWAFFPLYYIPNSHLSSYKLKPQTHNFRMEPIVHSLIVQLIWDSPNLIAMKQASRRALKEKDEIERVSLSKILFGTVSRLVGLLKNLNSFQAKITCCPATRRSSAANQLVSAVKDMPVHSIITAKTEDARLQYTSTGKQLKWRRRIRKMHNTWSEWFTSLTWFQ